jgi:hypothetical protein
VPAFDIDDLRVAAARHALGVLRGEEVVDLARRAALAGQVWEPVCELATVRDPYPAMRELAEPLEAWLAEAGVGLPDPDTAMWRVIRWHLAAIATGATAPHEGVVGLMHDVLHHLWDRPGACVGESHDVGDLVGVYYAYDDFPEGRDGHDALARSLAQAWLARHG